MYVAEAFVPNENSGKQVGYKDEDPMNVKTDNLYWYQLIPKHSYDKHMDGTTRNEGNKTNTIAEPRMSKKLTEEEMQEIRDPYEPYKPGHTFNDIAKKYGIGRTTFYKIIGERKPEAVDNEKVSKPSSIKAAAVKETPAKRKVKTSEENEKETLTVTEWYRI